MQLPSTLSRASTQQESVRTGRDAWQWALLISILLLTALFVMGSLNDQYSMVQTFLFRQDLPVAIVMICTLLWLYYLSDKRARAIGASPTTRQRPMGRIVAATMLLLVVAGWAGHHWLLADYALSRDEQMALQDARIFLSGQFAAPLAARWAHLHEALNVMFIPEQYIGHGWLSGYLPVNALLHAGMTALGAAALTTPLLNALGLFATWRIAVRLWPDQTDVQLVTVLLFGVNAQILALGMTSYAMAAYLALNTLWLLFFLKDRWQWHVAAMAIGFAATGIHQIAYHPAFAAPVLCLLLYQRRWALAGFYAVGYGVAMLFWMQYYGFANEALHIQAAPGATPSGGAAGLIHTARELLLAFSANTVWTMAAELVRFFAWQNLLLLPLLLIGGWAALRTRNPVLIALLATLLATVAMKFLLRPYQGHGWGYRYLHGQIGVACLLAGAGWAELKRRGRADWRQLRIATLVTLFAIMPWLFWRMHDFSGAYAAVDRKIAASKADFVIVANGSAPFDQDLVVNDPFLKKRPIRLLGSKLSPRDVSWLCAQGTVALIGRDDLEGIADQFLSKIEDAEKPATPQIATGC